MFRLRDDISVQVLAHLRDERPGNELILQERCFAMFLGRMQQTDDPDARLQAEERCFWHLDTLRLPLIERRDWQRLHSHADAARAAQPQQPRHIQRLVLYESLIAIQTQDYASGETMLNTLLADPAIDPEVRVRALNNLAHAHWFQSDFDRALAAYEEAAVLAEFLGRRDLQGHALHNMGLVYHEIGYYTQALTLIERALDTFRTLGDVHHVAHMLYEIGKNELQLGRWHDARGHFHEAAQIYERLDIGAQLANVYCLQGMLHHSLGEEAASETSYNRSLEIGQSLEHGDVAVTMDGQLLLGLLYQSQGRWMQALEAYERAITLAEQLQHIHSLAFARYRCGDIYKALGSNSAAIDRYREAIALIEKLHEAAEHEDVKLGLLGNTQQIYEALVLLLLDQGYAAEAYGFVERARSRAFLDMLADKSPDLYASFDQRVATLAEVQSSLPPDTLLIEYYTTGVLPTGEHLLHHVQQTNSRLFDQLMLPSRVVLFAVTRDRFEVRYAQVDPNSFRPQPDEIRPAQRWLQERKLRALYASLIGPVSDLLMGQQQCILVPHGPLHHVPFLALRAPEGRYLLDRDGPTIAFAPSATVLVRNCLARPQVSTGTLLALGYNDPRADLRHAESEARAVAQIMGGEAWTSSAPKSQALIDTAPVLRGLHIAGHAVYLPHDPLDSYLSLGLNDTISARQVMYTINLHADLVSLSACTSGLTHVVADDELFGMLRAFLYAGATTVVCALWEAADIVARLMMERFYQALKRGDSPGVAFRDALVAVRQMTGRLLAEHFERWQQEDASLVLPEIAPDQYDTLLYANPVDWASFILIGRA